MTAWAAATSTPAPSSSTRYTVNTPEDDGEDCGQWLAVRESPSPIPPAHRSTAQELQDQRPGERPRQRFWSVVLYDPQTRSQLQTSQPFPSKNNTRDKLITNADGSVDIYFGAQGAGRQGSQLDCDRARQGLFVVFRLYGPLEPWFDRSWRLGEPVQVK